jgi:hypothetical protein
MKVRGRRVDVLRNDPLGVSKRDKRRETSAPHDAERVNDLRLKLVQPLDTFPRWAETVFFCRTARRTGWDGWACATAWTGTALNFPVLGLITGDDSQVTRGRRAAGRGSKRPPSSRQGADADRMRARRPHGRARTALVAFRVPLPSLPVGAYFRLCLLIPPSATLRRRPNCASPCRRRSACASALTAGLAARPNALAHACRRLRWSLA